MRITALTITASDLAAASDFYHGVLGLKTRRTTEGFEAAVGRTTLVVRAGSPAWAGIHLAITIPRNRFADAKAWLSARTPLVTVDGADEFALADEPWCSKSLYFRGPDGIVLELITRDRLENDSSEPFSSASLLCISETGIASRDVPLTVSTLHSTFGAEPFGAGGDEFAPIGDDDGLFIVVADGARGSRHRIRAREAHRRTSAWSAVGAGPRPLASCSRNA